MTEKLREINITPKWVGIVHPLLNLYRTYKEKKGVDATLKEIREEFENMARAADLYNEKLAEERRLESLGGKK